jgi:nucleoside-diphosphate-sugar epimerase
MRIAIAGAGDLAKYLTEELFISGHAVVVLSRTQPVWFTRPDITFRTVDYASIPTLAAALSDCDALVSTILDYTTRFAASHLALIEACQQSPHCKSFIPSEYAGNTDEYPDQPAFYYSNHEPVRRVLREQTEIRWTLFNLGWLTDYLVPASYRYIKDIGDNHPVNLTAGTMKIPGTGDDMIAFTPVRDAAKAIVRLFDFQDWEPIIYVCGETTTWNEIAKKVKDKGSGLRVSHRSREILEKQVADARSDEEVIAAQYEIWSISGAGFLPQEKLARQREKYFKGIKFRTVDEFLADADKEDGETKVAL